MSNSIPSVHQPIKSDPFCKNVAKTCTLFKSRKIRNKAERWFHPYWRCKQIVLQNKRTTNSHFFRPNTHDYCRIQDITESAMLQLNETEHLLSKLQHSWNEGGTSKSETMVHILRVFFSSCHEKYWPLHVWASRTTIYFCNRSITGVSCLPKWKCNKLLTRRIIESHKKKSNAMESGRDLISITKPQSVKSDSVIRREDLGGCRFRRNQPIVKLIIQ